MKIRISLLCLVLVFFTAACVKPFDVACRELAKDPAGEFKYTDRQAAVACARAQFYAMPHLFTHDKKEDLWKLNQEGLLTSDVEKVMQDQAKSLNEWLSYKNKHDADWIDWFKGFREGLEKEERAVLEILRRLNHVKTYNEFTDAVGELPKNMKSGAVSYFFPSGRKFYSMRVLYPVRDLGDLKFTAEYLEVAKSEGRLKLVDSFEVSDTQKFAKKVPYLYDANDFTWDSRDRGWLIKSYKVITDGGKPADNTVHYIEIYRKVGDSAEVEDTPAVRGYLATGGSQVNIFVVDYDQKGTPGYGSPDKIVRSFGDTSTGKNLFFNDFLREKLLEAIYENPASKPLDRPERKRPRDREIYTSIVKMGDAKIDVWEQGKWAVPFDYGLLPFTLHIKYRKPMTPEEQRVAVRDKVKWIATITRSYAKDSESVVLEYWEPKENYSKQNIASAYALADALQIRIRGGEQKTAEVEHFGEYIKVIEYRYGGRWYQIMDEDKDGVFEKKREISDPTSSVSSS